MVWLLNGIYGKECMVIRFFVGLRGGVSILFWVGVVGGIFGVNIGLGKRRERKE